MKEKQNERKTAVLISGIILFAIAIVLAVFTDVLRFTMRMRHAYEMAGNGDLWEREVEQEEEWVKPDEDVYSQDSVEVEEEVENGEKEFAEDEEWEEVEYYDFADYIREDLSYQVDFEQEERSLFAGMVLLDLNYPVVSSENISNVDGINQAIQKGITDYSNQLEMMLKEIPEGINFECTIDGYVTYMSEEVLSVAYVEYLYWEEDFLESYVVCVNVDMTTGMVMDNTQILEMDDKFSIDFRERCEKQNGEVQYLSKLSDQDITEYLNDETVIIFYTPLGMEVGFNYYAGWVTVTYKDYMKFQKQL